MNRALIVSGPTEVSRRLLYALSTPLMDARYSRLMECLSPWALLGHAAVPEADFISDSLLIGDEGYSNGFCLYTSFRNLFSRNDVIALSSRFPELKFIEISLGFDYQFSGESYQAGKPVGDMSDFSMSDDSSFYRKHLSLAESKSESSDIEKAFDDAVEDIWKEALEKAISRILDGKNTTFPGLKSTIEFPLVHDKWGFSALDEFLWQTSPEGRSVGGGDYSLINTMRVDFESRKEKQVLGLFNTERLKLLMDMCEDREFARALAENGRIFNGVHVAVLASLERKHGCNRCDGLKNLLRYCDNLIFRGDLDWWAFVSSASPHAMSFLKDHSHPSKKVLNTLQSIDPSCQADFMEAYLNAFKPESIPDALLTSESKGSYLNYLIKREIHQLGEEVHDVQRKRTRISV